MSKQHTVALRHVMRVYNELCNDMDVVMRALGKKKTPSMKDLFFAVTFTWQMLSKHWTEVARTTSKLLISAHIVDGFQQLQAFWKWHMGMDIHPEDETFYTT
jgi:hypothetical protein